MDGLDRASEADDRKDESGNFTARGSERRSSGRPTRLQDRLAPTIRSVESACAIAGAKLAVAGVPQSFARIVPMLQCVLLPRGAPDPGAPPCIRQRLFPLTAGDIHGLPERVLAPQRGLESIGPVLRGWLVVILFYLRVRGSGTGSGSLMTLLGACGAQYGHISAHASSTPFPAQADYRSRQSSGCHC
jgi:hypothetical protein